MRRIEKAEVVRVGSLLHFYDQLDVALSRGQGIARRDLLPLPDAIRRYLRLEPPQAPANFAESVSVAAAEMLGELDLVEVLGRLLPLPVDLPELVSGRIRALSESDRRRLVCSLLARDRKSPLTRLQLARVLVASCSEDERLVRVAQRIVGGLLSQRGELELSALLEIVRWTLDELGAEAETTNWPASALLAVAWLHGGRLFSMLRTRGVKMQDVLDRFSRSSSRIFGVFGNSSPWEGDVANPHNVIPEALLISALGGDRVLPRVCLTSESGDRLRALALLETDAGAVLKLPIIPDIATATNHLSSFLGRDSAAFLEELFAQEGMVSTVRRLVQEQALEGLKKKAHGSWTAVKLAFGNYPIPDSFVPDLERALKTADFSSVVKEDAATACRVLSVAASFLKFVSPAVAAGFRQQLRSVAQQMRELAKGPSQREIATLFMEAVLSVSRCAATPEARVSEFESIVSELVLAWPFLGEVARPLVQRLCEDLPLVQSMGMWRLNLRLRSH